jgi:DNA-binding NtrC family response regulator
VVHGIVHDHGGAIEVASRPGEGTTLSVYLPLHAGPVVAVAAEEPKSVVHGNGEHVLIVDDEPSVGQAYAGLLARIGYHATVFDDPLAALARFRETPDEFEVVVSDITMPHMTGDALAREIQSLRPKLPVLLMTAYSSSLTREAAVALGAFDLLSKPLALGALAEAVHRALAHAADAER